MKIKNVLNYRKPGFWLILCLIIIAATVGIGLAANSKSSVQFNGSLFHVKEILYQSGMYSFAYTLETAPQYGISSDYKLYGKETADKYWSMLGELYLYEISKDDLNKLFISLPYDNSDYTEAIDRVKLVYRADKISYTDTGNNKTFYLVMQLKDGNVLLATGYDLDDNRHIRWLFRLEKQGKFNDEAIDISPDDIHQDETNDTSGEEQQAILETPLLTPDMSIGVGVFPDYISDEMLIFHGYFGLFVYDLKTERITFAADIGKAVGTMQIQGSEGAAVRVSEDGATIQLYYYSEQGESEMAYIIDTRTGDYKYDRNVPISPFLSMPDDIHYRFTGNTLGELTYTDGEKSWLIFKDWDWHN